MTEDEAKTKWCPHVRDADENHGSYNRWKKWITETIGGVLRHKHLDEWDEGCLCIGSECMAWRESNVSEGGLYMGLTVYQWVCIDRWCVGKTIQANGDDLYDTRLAKYRLFIESGENLPDEQPKAHGFCGLAGKP